MSRTSANYDTTTKAKRLKLDVREPAYYRQIGQNKRLGYVRRAAGDGSWLVATYENGKVAKVTIGRADDISRADGELILTFEQAQLIAAGNSPTTPMANLTVAAAIETYYRILKATKPNADEYKQNVESHLWDKIATSRVDKLGTTELKLWFASLVMPNPDINPDATPVSQSTANRILSQLKAPLNAAFQDEKNRIPSCAAWTRVKAVKLKLDEGVRTADLDYPQVQALVAAAATFDQALANLMYGTFLIGCRPPSELANLERRHLDVANSQLRLPGSKTGGRTVSLTAQAVAFFAELAKDKLPAAPLFPRADGSRWPRSGHYRDVKAAVALAELPGDVSLYTLRHAHISRAIEAGMSLKLIAKNCGTSLRMIEKHYAHILDRVEREQIEKLGPKLALVAKAA